MWKISGWILMICVCASGINADIPVTDSLIIRLQAEALSGQGLGDGDSVSQWNDLATTDTVNGAVTQIGTYGLPTYQRDVLNGRAVVRFSNSHVLGTTAFSWPNVNAGVTMFAVFTGDSSGQTGERLCGIGSVTGIGGQTVTWDVSTTTTGSDGGSGFRFNNGKALVLAENPVDSNFHVAAIQIAQGGTYLSGLYFVDDMNTEVFDNYANSTYTLALPTTSSLTLGTSWINGAIGTSDYYSGDLAEILVYNRQLTSNEITLMIDYLKTEYGLNGGIPAEDIIIHLDASSLQGLNDGDAVTAWADSATEDSVDGTLSSVASWNSPRYYSNQIGGKPVVRFNSSLLASSNFSWPDVNGGVTVMAVFTGDSTGGDAQRMAQIGNSTGAVGQAAGLDAATSTGGSNSGSGFRFNNGSALAKAANPLTTDFHIGTWQIGQNAQYQTAVYYVDDMTTQTLDNMTNPANVLTFPSGGNTLAVGTGILGDYISTDAYTGDLAELLVYNRQLSISEIQTIQRQLYDKYFYNPIRVTPLSLELYEGQSDSIAVRLDVAPAEDVIISLTDLSEPNQVQIAPKTILFTVGNWDSPVSVQVTAIADNWLETAHQTDMQIAAQSADLNYQNISTQISIQIYDDQCSELGYVLEDLNQDCSVNLEDITLLVESWLWCDPMKDTACDDLR